MSKKSLTAKDVFVLTALAFIAYLIFLVISVVRYYSNISVRAQLTPLLSLSPQLAKERRHVNGSAYVFLALGAQANSMSCAGAVESLVRYGGWSGDVYLITDRPSCFDREQIVSAAEMEDDRLHIIAVHGAFSSGGFDPAQEVRFRRARLLSLTMKTRIFELIDNKSIEVLAFVDCDVIVGVEGCPAEFIASGPQFPEYSVKFSRMYFADESGLVLPILKTQEECIKEGASFVDVHSGTFVVHRRHSEDLMRLWRDEMETFEHVRFHYDVLDSIV